MFAQTRCPPAVLQQPGLHAIAPHVTCLRTGLPRCSPQHSDTRTNRHVAGVVADKTAELQTSTTVEREAPRWTPEQYAGLWTSRIAEESYWIDAVDGTIPPSLEGTWYRNGPGTFEMGGHPMHVFDGHGLVGRVAFSGGRAHFASRFVRTPVFEEEMAQQRVLFRGFGSTKPGGFLANIFDIRDKPVANTSLAEWNGKLWALWEAHRPFILDPSTLETFGEETLDGALRENQAFCAHPKFDAGTGRLVAFSLGLRGAEGKLHIMELTPEGSVYQKITLPGIFNPVTYLHDFMVTPNWYIFHRPPLKVRWDNMIGNLLGVTDQTKMVDFDSSRAGQWMLISRDPDGPRIEIDTPPQFIWHYASTQEHPDTGVLTIDACVFDEFAPGAFDLQNPSTLSKSTLRRFEVDPERGTSSMSELCPHAADFPTINPAFAGRDDFNFVYMAACTERDAAFPFQSIIKANVQTQDVNEWKAPAGCFVGEAVFVPQRGPTTLEALHDEVLHISDSGNGSGGNGSGNGSGSSSSSGPAGASFNVNGSHRGTVNGSGGEHTGGAAGLLAGAAVAQQQRDNEDDGYLITPMYDGKRDQSSVVILDAADVAAGPVAQLHLKHAMPFAFHCLWSDGFHGPEA